MHFCYYGIIWNGNSCVERHLNAISVEQIAESVYGVGFNGVDLTKWLWRRRKLMTSLKFSSRKSVVVWLFKSQNSSLMDEVDGWMDFELP